MRSSDETREIFNLRYNNVNSGQAPGLNDYEVSLFLTAAQREIIEGFYSGNAKGLSFEKTEKVRKNLSIITKEDTVNLNNIIPTTKNKNFVYRVEFENDNKPWRVLSEHCIVHDSVKCLGNTDISVKPVRHNDLNKVLINPFRQPSEYSILRIDIEGKHELYSKFRLSSYNYRYIAFPTPIILCNLNTFKTDELGLPNDYNIAIDNITNESFCVFDIYMQDIIISRAVELATLGYKENSLQGQLMTNLRKE